MLHDYSELDKKKNHIYIYTILENYGVHYHSLFLDIPSEKPLDIGKGNAAHCHIEYHAPCLGRFKIRL